MNQFNAIIISLVIACLFQIFCFHISACNNHYAAFTLIVKEISENIRDIIRGINTV